MPSVCTNIFALPKVWSISENPVHIIPHPTKIQHSKQPIAHSATASYSSSLQDSKARTLPRSSLGARPNPQPVASRYQLVSRPGTSCRRCEAWDQISGSGRYLRSVLHDICVPEVASFACSSRAPLMYLVSRLPAPVRMWRASYAPRPWR